MKKWFWINIILKMFDIGTTYYCVKLQGFRVEKNPLVRWLFEHMGLDLASISVLIFFAFLMYILYQKGAETMLKIIATLMTLVALNNFIHIILHTFIRG